MKKTLVLLISFCFNYLFISAQDYTVFNFEDVQPANVGSWSDTFVSGVNPTKDAVNGSNTAGLYTHKSAWSDVSINTQSLDSRIYGSYEIKYCTPYATSGTVSIACFASDGTQLDWAEQSITAAGVWVKFTRSIILSKKISRVMIAFNRSSGATGTNNDQIYFDDFIFKRSTATDLTLYNENFRAGFAWYDGTQTVAPSTRNGRWSGFVNATTPSDAAIVLVKNWNIDRERELLLAPSAAASSPGPVVTFTGVNLMGFDNLKIKIGTAWPNVTAESADFNNSGLSPTLKTPKLELQSGSGNWVSIPLVPLVVEPSTASVQTFDLSAYSLGSNVSTMNIRLTSAPNLTTVFYNMSITGRLIIPVISWTQNLTGLKKTDSPVTLTATSTVTSASTPAGSNIVYTSSNNAVVSVTGNTLTVVGEGVATITASQAANSSYAAAVDVVQNVTVSKATPNLSISGTQSFTYNGSAQGPSTVSYNGDGTTSLLYSSTDGAGYSSSSAPTNAGNYKVVVSATAGSNYAAANSTDYTFEIVPATLTFNTAAIHYASDYAAAQLANSDLVVSSGEFVVNQTPTTVKSITVAPGAKLSLGSNVLNASNGIVLQSNETGTATMVDSYSAPTVQATVKQYVEAGRNWYISSPVKDASYTSLNRGTSVVEWNEVFKRWDNVTSENANLGKLESGKGYVQVATSTPAVTGTTGTVDFSGLANAGDVSIQLSRTESGLNRGFNLVGNPYPSYLDWKKVAVANTNVLPTIWMRSKTAGGNYTFATVNVAAYLDNHENAPVITSTAKSLVTTNIPPMQAYWVRLNASPSSTEFKVTNEMRAHADHIGNLFKAPSQKTSAQPLIRLKVSNDTNFDETVLYFNQHATDGLDKYDSPKMTNAISTIPEIYSKVGNENLVINGMKSIPTDSEIVLGFSTGQSNVFSIKVAELSNFDSNINVYLKDNLLGTQLDLTDGTAYTFSSGVASNVNRFSLMFKTVGAISNLETASDEQQIQLYWNSDKKLTVNCQGALSEKAFVSIYNACGQKVASKQLVAPMTVLDEVLNSGIYLVKITKGGKSKTLKVLQN